MSVNALAGPSRSSPQFGFSPGGDVDQALVGTFGISKGIFVFHSLDRGGSLPCYSSLPFYKPRRDGTTQPGMKDLSKTRKITEYIPASIVTRSRSPCVGAKVAFLVDLSMRLCELSSQSVYFWAKESDDCR